MVSHNKVTETHLPGSPMFCRMASLRFIAHQTMASQSPVSCTRQLRLQPDGGNAARWWKSSARLAHQSVRASQWPWWVRPSAGGDRFVYVGNLPFCDSDIARGLGAMLHQALPHVKVSITVSGWEDHKRKSRDEGKANRGHVTISADTASDAAAVTSVLYGEAYAGRSLKVVQGTAAPALPDVPLVDEADREQKRLHNKGARRRRKLRAVEELEVLLSALLCPGSTHLDRAVKSLYTNWADREAAMALGSIDWSNMPEVVDPLGQNKRGGAQRGLRKRRQIQSILAIIRVAKAGAAGQTVVDFGCGTGNLLLPLATLFPQLQFVGVDLNARSVSLLQERATAAGLMNVSATVGLIEEYEGPCDIAVALHVCGAGTDAVLMQAQARGSCFIVAPCCVGKLREGGMKSVDKMRAQASTLCEEERSASSGVGLTVKVLQGAGLMRVQHPRSTWMRSVVDRESYLQLAAAADWSGHQGTSSEHPEEGRMPRVAKTVIEADRGAAAREAGYGVHLMKLLYRDAGIRDDVLIGCPLPDDPLAAHVCSTTHACA